MSVAPIHTSRWLIYRLDAHRATLKTNVWTVLARESRALLGEVRWYTPWRKYVFYPSSLALFDPACLRDIALFVEEATAEHRRQAGDGRER